VASCEVICGTTPVLLYTTKNYNVLLQYYSNVLLRTTKYYASPTAKKKPHNLPPRNCQATNEASASTDAVQLLLQSGRVTEDAVLPPVTGLHRLTNVGNRETTWPPGDACAAPWHVRAVSRRSGFTFHSLYLSANGCVEKGFGQDMTRFFKATNKRCARHCDDVLSNCGQRRPNHADNSTTDTHWPGRPRCRKDDVVTNLSNKNCTTNFREDAKSAR